MSLKNFRTVALLEATSFLLLLLSSVLKRTSEFEIGVTVLGPIHGILFIAFVVMALVLRAKARWTPKQTLLILLGAVVPFGGYVVDAWVTRNNATELKAEDARRI